MVCISPSPLSAKLVRAAHQLAEVLQAEWFAVYVEGSRRQQMNEASQKRLVQVMRLVEELGATVVTIHGDSIPESLLHYARQHQVTKIIVGHPTLPRWRELLQGSVVDHLVKHNSGLDIHIISSGQPDQPLIEFTSRHLIGWKNYALAGLLVLLATLIALAVQPFVFPATLVTLYLLSIIIGAAYLGYRSALLATVLSVLAFYILFTPSHFAPRGEESLPYAAILAGLSIAGIVITRLVATVLERAEIANRRADQIMELYSLSRDLSTTVDLENIIKTIILHLSQTFQAEVIIFLPEAEGLAVYQKTASYPLNEQEWAVARHVFALGQERGFSTLVQGDAAGIYLPLRTAHQRVGVIGIAPRDRMLPTLNQRRLMDAFANQAALAIEANRLVEQTHQSRLAQEGEKLQAALLDSISHDLRTPLVSITGTLSSLREDASRFDSQTQQELLDDAWQEAERLNRLVDNLLEMSRLRYGKLSLNKDYYDFEEVIAVARAQLRNRLHDYPIKTHIAPNIPLIPIDFTLMVQTLVNLLDNAAKYSQVGQTIEICATVTDEAFILQIADQGTGIPEEQLAQIFQKFYRASNVSQIQGSGLGLSICEGIIEAHNGKIQAANRPEGGAMFEVHLPLKEGT